jgi:hypothetical protein
MQVSSVMRGLSLGLAGWLAVASAFASGPLRVSDQAAWGFVDQSGRPVYLVGSHTWNNIVDMDAQWPPRRFDYPRYLDFLATHHFNLTRLWTWEVPAPDSERYPRRQVAAPLPWLRTGPGSALDGRPRFDLGQFDPEYFERLRQRVAAAAERDIYVIVILFEGWAVQFAPGKHSHPFAAANNINDIDCGADPRSIHSMQHADILALQESYIRKVVDTVNEFDNVLYEVVNEAGPYSTEWQSHVIEVLASYQGSKPRQHPIGVTFQFPDGDNATLWASGAQWVSPGPEDGRTLADPPVPSAGKAVISDTDHLLGSTGGTEDWAWRSFTRGSNLLYMDRYLAPDSVTDESYPRAHRIRAAMGDTRLVARILEEQDLVPRPDLATTRFVLAGASALLVYQPNPGPFFVDTGRLSGPLRIEWLDTDSGRTLREAPRAGGRYLSFRSPFSNPSVLLIRQDSGAEQPGLIDFEQSFRELRASVLSFLEFEQALKERLRRFLVRTLPSPTYREMVYAFAGGMALMLVIMAMVMMLSRFVSRRSGFERSDD